MSDVILDTAFLQTLRDDAFGPDGSEDFKDLLRIYVSNGEKLLKEIPVALERNDRQEAIRLAHSLKGASASVGASKMAAASKVMEMTLKGLGDANVNLQELLNAMKAEFVEARMALQKYIQS